MTQRRLERGVRQWKRRAAAALDPVERAKASRKVLEWQARLDAHIEAVNARRESTETPAMVKQPGRARVVYAPDAVRTATEAAGFRRSVAAADRKTAKSVDFIKGSGGQEPTGRRWDEVADVREAEQWARERFGLEHVAFGGHRLAADSVNETFEWARERGLELPRRVVVDANDPRLQGRFDLIAGYDHERDELLINPAARYWRSQIGQGDVALTHYERGVWSTGDRLHPVKHEVYHRNLAVEAPDRYRRRRVEVFTTEEGKIVRHVSKRATRNRAEFAAEYLAGADYGIVYSDAVKELFDQLWVQP